MKRHDWVQKKGKTAPVAMTHRNLQRNLQRNTLEQNSFTEPFTSKDSPSNSSAISNFNFANISVQPKLTVGAANDPYEQEADRVAAQVVKQLHTPAIAQQDVQRMAPEDEEEEAQVQRKPTIQCLGHEGGDVSSDLESEIQGARGSGASLAPQLQTQMGQAMGADFSRVRIHTDTRADQLNQSIQAKAFTTGKDVFFKQGEYNPSSRSGQSLIAHELTHVVQQNGADVQRQSVQGLNITPQMPNISRQATPQIQRLLITSKQLKRVAGEPKGNILGKTMSGTYKKILKSLDDYDTYLTTQEVEEDNFKTQSAALKKILNDLNGFCLDYLQSHESDSDQDRYKAIQKLSHDISVEKSDITAMKEHADILDGFLWRSAISNARYGESGGLVVPKTATTVHTEVGLEAKFAKNTDIYEEADLSSKNNTVVDTAAKNDPCMRYDVPGDKSVLGVHRFGGVDKDGKYEHPVSKDKKGYVPAKAVTKGDYKHEDLAEDVPIFDGIPSVDDTQQGAIGDCYLIAALASVVRKAPAFIYDMIKDDGQGNITVRLFDGGAPVYVDVKKSLITGGRHSEKALWVPLIEKAYAGYFHGSYAQMEGGEMSESWSRLTGEASEQHELHGEGGMLAKGSLLFWQQNEIGDGLGKKGSYELIKLLHDRKPDMLTRSAPYQITGDKPQALELMDWLLAPKNLNLVKRFRTAGDANNIQAFSTVLDDFSEVDDLSEQIKQKILTLIPKLYGGDEAGAYTGGQEDLFTEIAEALDAGQYVGAGTKNTLPEPSKGEGKSAGETKARGIAGKHAYSIIGYSEKGGLKFLKLRNPWASYGVEYVKDDTGNVEIGEDQKPVRVDDEAQLNQNDGVFDLELAEFTRYYSKIHFGNQAQYL